MNKKIFFVFNKLRLPLFFFVSILLIFLFSSLGTVIVKSDFYFFLLSLVFVCAFCVFIFLIFQQVKNMCKNIKNYDKKDLYSFIVVAVFLLFFVFYVLKGNFNGRFSVFPEIMGNIFLDNIKENFPGTIRTYSFMFYSVLGAIFQMPITPLVVLTINKIFSVFILIIVFLISREVFKKNWIGFFVLASFVSSLWIQKSLSSIEYGVMAAFFVHTSILFLLKYSKNRRNDFLILSIVCLVLATLYRTELAFLFGLPYLAFFNIFLYTNGNNKSEKKLITGAFFFLVFVFMSVIVSDFSGKDLVDVNFIQGRELDNYGFVSLIINIQYLLENNLGADENLLLENGFVSLFFYISLFFSFILIVNLVWFLFKGYIPNKFSNFAYFFCFYFLVYFLSQVAFHFQGMEAAFRYSVNYFICEIILSYLFIFWVIGRLRFRRKPYPNFLSVLFVFILFFVVYVSSPSLSYELNNSNSPEAKEMFFLLKNVDLDKECRIIKSNVYQPRLDFYYGVQENSVFFGFPPEMYFFLSKYKQKSRCYYYYHEILLEKEYLTDFRHRINSSEIDLALDDCKKEIVFSGGVGRNSLTKYSC